MTLPKWAKYDKEGRLEVPEKPAPPPKTLLSADQVILEISQLAEHGEGADKRWALAQMRAQASQVGLPAPLDDEEGIVRLARLMQGYGRNISRKAFRVAFRDMSAGDKLFMTEAEPPPVLPKTLEEFYERFPLERPESYPVGYPKGFPYRGKRVDRDAWLERRSIQLIRAERKAEKERKRKEKEANAPTVSGIFP